MGKVVIVLKYVRLKEEEQQQQNRRKNSNIRVLQSCKTALMDLGTGINSILTNNCSQFLVHKL